MSEWKPGDADSEIERLQEKVRRLEQRIHQLENAHAAASWALNPDRSGGAYTEHEIRDSQAWR